MKRKILMWVLMLAMLTATAAHAQSFDLSLYSADELRSLISQAQAALQALEGDAQEAPDAVYSDENLVITLTGAKIEYGALVLGCVIENRTGRNLLVSTENSSINGWDVLDAVASVNADSKARTELTFYDVETSAEITEVGQVDRMSFRISYFDEDDWDFKRESEALELQINP